MPELSVAVVAADSEQRAVLQVLVDGTSVAKSVHSSATLPVAATDPVLRRIHSHRPEVVLVDVPSDNSARRAPRNRIASPGNAGSRCIRDWKYGPAPDDRKRNAVWSSRIH